MASTYKNCQSCDMPLKKQENRGTNTDETPSEMYCKYCYEKGAFKQPDVTAQQMQEFVKKRLKEMKFPGFMAWFFTRRIPRLERWKSKS